MCNYRSLRVVKLFGFEWLLVINQELCSRVAKMVVSDFVWESSSVVRSRRGYCLTIVCDIQSNPW